MLAINCTNAAKVHSERYLSIKGPQIHFRRICMYHLAPEISLKIISLVPLFLHFLKALFSVCLGCYL